MTALRDVLRETIRPYAGNALNGYIYLTENETGDVFITTVIAEVQGKKLIQTGIIARIEGNLIVIEHDISNKPLVDALIQAGVSRENIVLAYAGEKVPTRT